MKQKLLPEEELIKDNFSKGGELKSLIRNDLTKKRLEIFLESLSLKTQPKEISDLILKRLRQARPCPFRWKKKRKNIERILNNCSAEELRRLFLVLAKIEIQKIRPVTRYTKGLGGLIVKLSKGEGVKEIENLYQQRKFTELIFQKKFQDKTVDFPIITLSPVLKRGREIFLLIRGGGEGGEKEIRSYLNKNDFPLESEVIIFQKRFEEPYGWIFEINRKDAPLVKSERFVRENTRGKSFSLINLNEQIIHERRQMILNWIDGKVESLSSFQRPYRKRSGFYLAGSRKRTLKVFLDSCCQSGDMVEVMPVPTKTGYNLEFYKIEPNGEKIFLRCYRLRRQPPYLTLVKN